MTCSRGASSFAGITRIVTGLTLLTIVSSFLVSRAFIITDRNVDVLRSTL